MKDPWEEPGKSYRAIERVLAWLVAQFDLATSLLAAFAEFDHRTDVEETVEHRTV